METLEIIESLNEAITLITKARGPLAGGSFTIWQILNHAEAHLDAQIKALLAPLPETVADLLPDNDGGRTRIGNTPTCEDCEQPADHCYCEN